MSRGGGDEEGRSHGLGERGVSGGEGLDEVGKG